MINEHDCVVLTQDLPEDGQGSRRQIRFTESQTCGLCLHGEASERYRRSAWHSAAGQWPARRRRGSHFHIWQPGENRHRPGQDTRRLNMTIKLDQRWVTYLTTQPESGMGYQKVDLRLKDKRVLKNVLVFNAEEIELPEDCAAVEIQELHLNRG